MDNKTCTKCFISKPYSQFSKESKVKDGHKASCKECLKHQKHIHYINNKEKYKRAYDEFMLRNPDYFKKVY